MVYQPAAAPPADPVLSIITPVFNGARFLQSCLDNVEAQGCPVAEHIVVDGASHDETVAILAVNAARLPYLSYLSESDRGQSHAMNKGIALARGTYMTFLNVDDYFEPGVLNRVVGIIRDLDQPRFLAGNCNVWGDGDALQYVNRPSRLELDRLVMGPAYFQHPYNPSAYFYPRALHDMVGPYDEREHYALDLEFILRAMRALPTRYFDETWGNFRNIDGTKTVTHARSGLAAGVVRRIFLANFRTLPWRTRLLVMARLAYYKIAIPPMRAWQRHVPARRSG